MTARLRALIASCAPLLVVGCTLGPAATPPEPETPERFQRHPQEVPVAPSALETAWWHKFHDPGLDALVEQVLTANPDLATAEARVRISRARRKVARAPLRPTLGLSGSGGRSRASANAPGGLAELAQAGLADLENERWAARLDAGWELDLFGADRRAAEAAEARLGAARARRDGIRLALVAETTRAWIERAAALERLRAADDRLTAADTLVADAAALVGTGLAPPERAAEARGVRARIAEEQHRLRGTLDRIEHRLAVLAGRPPGALPLPAPEGLRTPSLPFDVPANVLRRRPDLRAAEAELAAASAEVGVAIAQRFPDFSLTAALGVESGGLADLALVDSRIWSYGGGLLAPVFRGGALASGVDVARSVRAAELSEYEALVLRALEDVENALVAHRQAADVHGEMRRLREARAAIRRDRGAREAAGLLRRTERLRAELDALGALQLLAEAQAAERLALVDLYEALGAGTEPAADLGDEAD